MGSHDISAPWRTFLVAFRAGDEAVAVEELRNYIRAWDDAFWANDFSSFGAVYTDDVVLMNRTRLPSVIGPSPQRGIDGFERLRKDIVDAARFFRFDVEELRHASGDRLVALGHLRARSRYAGLVLRTGFAAVWTMRGDKICRAEGFTSRRKALQEAGLRGTLIDKERDDEGGLVSDARGHDDLAP
jgi:ketosteroid isomerase-like protein